MSRSAQELASAKEWNSLVKTNVEKALGAKLDGDFTAANYPAGFNYAVKQQYYNKDSLSSLDSLIKITDGTPSLSDSYSTLYKNVIGNLKYDFSAEDKQKMQQEEADHDSMVGTIINLYSQSGLDDTPAEYPSIIYIMNRIKEVTGDNYLNIDVRTYPNLASLCRNLSEYARTGVFTAKMQNAWSLASDRMNAICEHISNPNENNGALKTNGNTFNIGWDKLPETQQLLNSLKQDSKIALSFSVENFEEASGSLKYGSGASGAVSIPICEIININIGGSHKHELDISTYALSDAKLSVSVVYKGITMLGAVPTPLSNNNSTGWYAGDILTEAAEKSGKDATGYKLNGSEFDPQRLFGENGQLRRLKTFVISQRPEITLHFSKFDCSAMQTYFKETTKVSFSMLFGLIHAETKNECTFSKVSYNESEQSLDVTITPPPIDTSGSTDKQTAFILGGVVESYNTL